ncbi:MAG: radical SAM protein [Candidatus Woesearchaeota archaeon]
MARKILRGFPEYYADFDWDSGLFMFTIGLPFNCNYRCPKCAFSDSKTENSLPLKRKLDLIQEARNLGAKVFLVTGEGEPLIPDEFRDLVRGAYQSGLDSVIFTNASDLDTEIAQFCFDHNVGLILSVDSLIRETYDLLTGTKGFFDIAKENIDYARSLYKYDLTKRDENIMGRLALNCVVTLQNMGEIPNIRDWCGDDICFICNYPVYSGDAKRNWQMLTGMENGEANPELVEIATDYTERPQQTFTRPVGGCASLLNGIELCSDGKAIICAGGRENLLGDGSYESLRSIWERKKEFIGRYRLYELECLPRSSPELYIKICNGLKNEA